MANPTGFDHKPPEPDLLAGTDLSQHPDATGLSASQVKFPEALRPAMRNSLEVPRPKAKGT